MTKIRGNIFYTYILYNPSTGVPFYVGKGYGSRMYYHQDRVGKGKLLKNKHLYYTILKIISNNENIVYKKVLENVDEGLAFREEGRLILEIGRADLNTGPLCNMTDGGDGSSGLIYTEEMKKARSERMVGSNNPMFGKQHSGDSKKIISEKKKQRDNFFIYKHTKEHREMLSKDNRGGKKTSKPVQQLDSNGNFIFTWPSARAAAKAIGASHGNISACAKQKTNWKVKGFYWRFA